MQSIFDGSLFKELSNKQEMYRESEILNDFLRKLQLAGLTERTAESFWLFLCCFYS